MVYVYPRRNALCTGYRRVDTLAFSFRATPAEADSPPQMAR
jgi:hypothetical protein